MISIKAELYGQGSSNAIVRMPGRQRPGVLVQGDSLAALVGSVQQAEAGHDALDLFPQRLPPQARPQIPGTSRRYGLTSLS